jgi:hypothetical protein
MIQLSSSSLTFSPRKKASLQEDFKIENLRSSLISSPSNQQNAGKDLAKSQVTFSFTPKNLHRANGGKVVTGNDASPLNREFWSPKPIKTANPEAK